MLLIDRRSGERAVGFANQRDSWMRRCGDAARLIDAQPDAAALLLDGLLHDIASAWIRRLGHAGAPAEGLLAEIECVAPLVGWRLRLALRAPDIRARLAACQALIEAMK